MNKQVSQLLDETNLDDSFVIGFYGGGNYGDELLFEVLQHLFHVRKYRAISFLYQNLRTLHRYHSDLGYQPVESGNKMDILQTVLHHRKIVVGGGGLWGLDVNLNILLMSAMLFFARFLLGKEVYLIGVGYYDSTNHLGHFAAWLAGKSANQILARDEETYRNFHALNPRTFLSDDIAFLLPKIHKDVSVGLEAFERSVGRIDAPTVMISLRRFKPSQPNVYVEVIEKWLHEHRSVRVILALMEPRELDPGGFMLLKQWQREHGNAAVIDFDYNPLVLYKFFEKNHDKLSYVGPQFHVQLVAHLGGVPFLPLTYDNKVTALLSTILPNETAIPIKSFTLGNLQAFTDE